MGQPPERGRVESSTRARSHSLTDIWLSGSLEEQASENKETMQRGGKLVRVRPLDPRSFSWQREHTL